MTKPSTNKLLPAGLLFLLLGGLGVAYAQTLQAKATDDVGARSTSGAEAISPQQMRIQAQTFLPQMDQAAQTARRQLEQSREARDVVKVLCLNDKLNQIDVAIRASRDRMPVLMAALDKNDAENSRHEFAVLQVLRDRVRTLVQESNQCIGEEAGFVGESKVIVSIDPGIPSNDTTQFPSDTSVIFVPPSVASMTK
jgi:enamine deaminase RidA (YjgF/YER057c/UK114 family)